MQKGAYYYMKNWTLLLLVSFFIVLSSCAPQESSPAPPDYDQIKKMVVDILKTDEGKKAIQDVMTEDKVKQQMIMDQAVVKQTIEQILTSKKGEEFWKTMFQDPKFVESFAKSLKTEQEKTIKSLMKDPEYQGMMINILQNPEMEKEFLTVLKSKDFRNHLQTVMTETFDSPLFKAKIQDLLMKAAENMQTTKKQSGSNEDGGESEEGDGDQQTQSQ